MPSSLRALRFAWPLVGMASLAGCAEDPPASPPGSHGGGGGRGGRASAAGANTGGAGYTDDGGNTEAGRGAESGEAQGGAEDSTGNGGADKTGGAGENDAEGTGGSTVNGGRGGTGTSADGGSTTSAGGGGGVGGKEDDGGASGDAGGGGSGGSTGAGGRGGSEASGGTGTGNVGGTGGSTSACDGAPQDTSCACLKVASDGDDALALASDGALEFANVQSALDYAAARPSAPQKVCVAEGSFCGRGAVYSAPTQSPLTMRNGVSLYGGYESTTWTYCDHVDPVTTLVMQDPSGVYFGPEVQSATTLEGFRIDRGSTAVTLDGATSVSLSHILVGMASNRMTSTGIHAVNGADATLTRISMPLVAGGDVCQPPRCPTPDFSLPWSSDVQVAVRADGATLRVRESDFRLFMNDARHDSSATLATFTDSPNSSLTDSNLEILAYATGAGTAVEVTRSPGFTLDGTNFGVGSSQPRGAIFVDSPGVSWVSGTLDLRTSSAEDGIVLDASPHSSLEVSGNGFTVRTRGDVAGTSLRGSVHVEEASYPGVSVEDCDGNGPLIALNIALMSSNANGEGIRVTGACTPAIQSDVTIAQGFSAASAVPLTALTGIHCSTPSRCTISGSAIDIQGASYLPFPSQTVVAHGILCDDGSCPTVTDNTVSGLSRAIELEGSTYRGGGVRAPGATLVSGNLIKAGCTGGDGFGLFASGRIENNVVLGPTCGGTAVDASSFTDQLSHAVGIVAGADSDVHSNTVDGGGAIDGVPSGQIGCRSVGIELTGGNSTLSNDIVQSQDCATAYAILDESAPPATPNALVHNDLLPRGGLHPLYFANGSSAALMTPAEVNGLPGASGNFSADPLLDAAFLLTSGSPCIDAGRTDDAPATDIEGDPRDAAPDVGADEWTGPPNPCRRFDCSAHGTCQVSGGNSACTCDPAWSGTHCEVANPCGVDHGGCDPHTLCTNVDGNASCGSCPSGYDGTGATGCVDVDECATSDGGCVAPSVCRNLVGSFECACPLGYTGKPQTGCARKTSCADAGGGCDPLASCTDTPTGPSCGPCPAGYYGTGATGCSATCPCQHGGTCTSSEGAYACTCPATFAGGDCEVSFVSVATSESHVCGLRSDGHVVCWGYNASGDTHPPPERFIAVSAGLAHSCGIREHDLALECWGVNAAPVPSGAFKALAATVGANCAIAVDGTLECWLSGNSPLSGVPSDTFKQIAGSSSRFCAIDTTDLIQCFGDPSWSSPPPGQTAISVSDGARGSAAVLSDGTIACWFNGWGFCSPPPGSFKSVSAGESGFCAIATDDTLVCFGDNGDSLAPPPSGTFKAVSVGYTYACAIRTNDALVCWGTDTLATGALTLPY